jgi:hypothetical protein
VRRREHLLKQAKQWERLTLEVAAVFGLLGGEKLPRFATAYLNHNVDVCTHVVMFVGLRVGE